VNPQAQRSALLLGVVVLGLGAVALALWTQHALGMEPCAWCVLQRLIFVAIALVALPGVVWRRSVVQQIAAALWQHFVAAASDSCKLTLAERIISGLGLDGSLPEIFQPRASCADAAVKLLGLHYEFWSLMLFVLLGVMALRVLLRGTPR